ADDFCWRSLLNMASMRSVMRKPPTTFVEEQATAMKPRMMLSQSCISPATTREPISEMPEMALVADISGVCSRGGTREMTWYPRNPARMNMYSPISSSVVMNEGCWSRFASGSVNFGLSRKRSFDHLVEDLSLVGHQRIAR